MKAELAQLRLEVEAASAKGNSAVATVLEREFRAAFAHAKSLALDLSDFGQVLTLARSRNLEQKGAVETREKNRRIRARDAEVTLQPWLPVIELPSAGLNNQMVDSVVFSNDGSKIVTTSSLGVALLLDFRSKTLIKQLEGHSDGQFNADGTRILTGWGRVIGLWDGQTGESIQRLEFGGRAEPVSFGFFSNGQFIAGMTSRGEVRVWEAAGGSLEATFRMPPAGDVLVKSEVSADGSLLVTTWKKKRGKGVQNVFAIYDARTGALLQSQNCGPEQPQSYNTANLVLSADGKTALTYFLRKHWALWDLGSGRLIAEQAHDIWAAKFSPDGARLVTLGPPGSGVGSSIRDSRTGAVIAELSIPPTQLDAVEWSADGRQLLTLGYREGARLWDLGTGGTIATLREQLPSAVSWDRVVVSPSGSWILTVSDMNKLHLWQQAAPPP